MLTALPRAAFVLAGLIACGLVLPSRAAVPPRQSPCEIWANKFRSDHPHADIDAYMKAGLLYFGGTVPPHPPPAYRDPQSGITFHVDADGRRITAVDAWGKRRWVRNPFVDRNMCPYRDAHPSIVWMGAPGGGFGWHTIGPFKPTPDAKANRMILESLRHGMDPAYTRAMGRPRPGDRFIGLTFNSSQFGYLNIRNGDFYGGGQN